MGLRGPKAKPKPIPKPCACGCGDLAKSGNIYINGHNIQLSQARMATIKKLKGTCPVCKLKVRTFWFSRPATNRNPKSWYERCRNCRAL